MALVVTVLRFVALVIEAVIWVLETYGDQP